MRFTLNIAVIFTLILSPSVILAQTNYTYNHLGQRVGKTNNGTTTVYPHQNYHTDGNTETTYIYANGERMATITDGVITYNHTDHLNSSTITTDASGNVVQVIDHYPFGDERLNEGTHQSHRTFTDHISDSETDLLYMNARYYDDTSRRFISQDPASLYSPERFLADPQQLNFYSYVGNNPLLYTDPSGLNRHHSFQSSFMSALGLDYGNPLNPGSATRINQAVRAETKQLAQTAYYGSAAVVTAGALGYTAPTWAPYVAPYSPAIFGSSFNAANRYRADIQDGSVDDLLPQYGGSLLVSAIEGQALANVGIPLALLGAGVASYTEQAIFDGEVNYETAAIHAGTTALAKILFGKAFLGEALQVGNIELLPDLAGQTASFIATDQLERIINSKGEDEDE